MDELLSFLARLEDAKIWYQLAHVRDSIMVILAVPGERWEVEFFSDGHTEVERFVTTGTIEDEDRLDQLIVKHRA